jgi:hypothetical protein
MSRAARHSFTVPSNAVSATTCARASSSWCSSASLASIAASVREMIAS